MFPHSRMAAPAPQVRENLSPLLGAMSMVVTIPIRLVISEKSELNTINLRSQGTLVLVAN